MEIKKVLKVESEVHFYRVIDNNTDLIKLMDGDSSIRIEYYHSLGAEYLYGCKCEEDANWERLTNEYQYIKSDVELCERLCKIFSCDRIDFA